MRTQGGEGTHQRTIGVLLRTLTRGQLPPNADSLFREQIIKGAEDPIAGLVIRPLPTLDRIVRLADVELAPVLGIIFALVDVHTIEVGPTRLVLP